MGAALDRLHSAPFDEFIALRRELAAALRGQGDAPSARLIAAVGKPTRTAWGLNQLAHKRAELLQALFEARDAAASAQRRGDAGQIRETVRVYRDRVAGVVGAVRQLLADAGMDLTAAQARRVAETLQATATEDPDARATLLAGRLTEDVGVDDPFAGIEVDATGIRERAKQPRNESAPRERDAARASAREREAQRKEQARQIEEARARVAALEEEARDARATARQAEVAATRAQSEAERARLRVADVEARCARAREELRIKTRS